jgi:hypothetical protein
MGKVSWEELSTIVNESTWEDEQEMGVREKSEPSIIEEIGKVLPKYDVFERKTEYRDRRQYHDATRHLVKDIDNGPVLDAAYQLRVREFRQNEQMLENAVKSTELCNRLSTSDKRTIAKKMVEVWELKRDIVRLESIQRILKDQVELANEGRSVNQYNAENAKARTAVYQSIYHPIGYKPFRP